MATKKLTKEEVLSKLASIKRWLIKNPNDDFVIQSELEDVVICLLNYIADDDIDTAFDNITDVIIDAESEDE